MSDLVIYNTNIENSMVKHDTEFPNRDQVSLNTELGTLMVDKI